METYVKKEEKQAVTEMEQFLKELTGQEKREFEFFIKGYRLAKGAQGKKSA